jgi:hypothetical protein
MKMSGWATFGTDILNELGTVGTTALANNPNLISNIVAGAIAANNPDQAKEDTALAQAEAEYPVSPKLAVKAIERAIGMIPPAYLAVAEALSMLSETTPVFTAIQAIDLARSKLKQAPGA